ncbi:hypothetical protein PPERSA_10969 [Pseudocohnilembus persalinus]|uniref:Glutamine amidotransferase type-2 domain-containing protein n=1 Tax=Pseudocohnilembus persalinus TaxID=266149 RepID=A0A0V0QCH3_PSEPJ|nr:hypothetical protein PPERSA_10969 [Pseudocohnilembus persalinus]|eukprot:KRW99850.1 hypothetical protein PPERSA_10969 [Pseudocohnilembus persalinus]
MCGIFFYLSGLPCRNNVFKFNPYLKYIDNPYTQNNVNDIEQLFGKNFDFIENLVKNELFLEEFYLNEVKNQIQRRGPDFYKMIQVQKSSRFNLQSKDIQDGDYYQKNKKTVQNLGLEKENDNFQNYLLNQKFEVLQEYSGILDNEKQIVDLLKDGEKNVSFQSIDMENLIKNQYSMFFCSSLLYLRGVEQVHMPIQKDGCYLMYNGEIYEENGEQENIQENKKFDFFQNDTQQLFDFLYQEAKIFKEKKNFFQENQDENYAKKIVEKLRTFIADFSFVFYDEFNQKILVSKGLFGKRSLLFGFSQNGFAISSAPIKIKEQKLNKEADQQDEELENNEIQQEKSGNEKINKQFEKEKPELKEFLTTKYFQEFLSGKEKEWVEIPDNVLIIGDLKTDQILNNNNNQQNNFKIEWNQYELGKDKLSCQSQETQILDYLNLMQDQFNEGQKQDQFLKINDIKNLDDQKIKQLNQLMRREKIPKDLIDQVGIQLENSVQRIVENINEYRDYFKGKIQQKKVEGQEIYENQKDLIETQQVFQNQKQQTKSEIAILFSGGLDSALLTYYIDKLIPPWASIDLLNLSFSEKASDRKTAINAYNELKKINPQRKYNFILIDQKIEDIDKYEKEILQIIYPKITHMDFNISLVLHLITKGEGYLYNQDQQYQQKDEGFLEENQDVQSGKKEKKQDQNQNQIDKNQENEQNLILSKNNGLNQIQEMSEKQFVQSGAKIVISGLGADEIFGGYSRYRVSFQRGGFLALQKEMKFDLNRIWIRNLGRDDRAISSNGKEARFPFLDEKLIQEVQKIDFGYFTNFKSQEEMQIEKEENDKKIKEEKKRQFLLNKQKQKELNLKKYQELKNQDQQQKVCIEKQQDNLKELSQQDQNGQKKFDKQKKQEQKQEKQEQLQEKQVYQQQEKQEIKNQTQDFLQVQLSDKRLLRNLAYQIGLQEVSGFKKKAIQFGTGLAKQSNQRSYGSHRKGKGTNTYQINR